MFFKCDHCVLTFPNRKAKAYHIQRYHPEMKRGYTNNLSSKSSNLNNSFASSDSSSPLYLLLIFFCWRMLNHQLFLESVVFMKISTRTSSRKLRQIQRKFKIFFPLRPNCILKRIVMRLSESSWLSSIHERKH